MVALNLATEGHLGYPECMPLTLATVGHLYCEVEVPDIDEVIKRPKSGSGTYKTVYKEKENKITMDRLYVEDEDILAIIKVFLECQ